MTKTFLARRWCGSVQNPNRKKLRAALAELSKLDGEHPDCWLSDEMGWTVAAFQSGKVVLENSESDEGPWHMMSQSNDQILKVWRRLQAGDIAGIRQMHWQAGYGGSSW